MPSSKRDGGVHAYSERTRLGLRFYAGLVARERELPAHRALYVSAEDPVTTFGNHWWRPRQSILKESVPSWLPLGGAALRGYHWTVARRQLIATNLELTRRATELRGDHGVLGLWLSAFGDAGLVLESQGGALEDVPSVRDAEIPLADAGFGMKFQGQFYDRPVTLRFDFPLFVAHPAIAIDRDPGRTSKFGPRWVVTFSDIW